VEKLFVNVAHTKSCGSWIPGTQAAVEEIEMDDLHIIHWLSSYDVKCNVGNSETGGGVQEHWVG
jgi:hypothetical protein